MDMDEAMEQMEWRTETGECLAKQEVGRRGWSSWTRLDCSSRYGVTPYLDREAT